MGDDSIDTVISHIDIGYLDTLAARGVTARHVTRWLSRNERGATYGDNAARTYSVCRAPCPRGHPDHELVAPVLEILVHLPQQPHRRAESHARVTRYPISIWEMTISHIIIPYPISISRMTTSIWLITISIYHISCR